MKFPWKGPVKPRCMLLGRSSLIITTTAEYIYGFVSHSAPHNPEDQPRGTARAREGLRAEKSTFPVAVHVLLLLI